MGECEDDEVEGTPPRELTREERRAQEEALRASRRAENKAERDRQDARLKTLIERLAADAQLQKRLGALPSLIPWRAARGETALDWLRWILPLVEKDRVAFAKVLYRVEALERVKR